MNVAWLRRSQRSPRLVAFGHWAAVSERRTADPLPQYCEAIQAAISWLCGETVRAPIDSVGHSPYDRSPCSDPFGTVTDREQIAATTIAFFEKIAEQARPGSIRGLEIAVRRYANSGQPHAAGLRSAGAGWRWPMDSPAGWGAAQALKGPAG
jgi:hypothetical protein